MEEWYILQKLLAKSNTPPWVFFSRFFNCTNGTKTSKASHIYTHIFSKTFKCSWLTEHFLMHRLLIHFRPIFRFYTPENIREIMVFWCFRGVHKRIIRLKCVKNYLDPGYCPVANLCKILENRLLNISRQNQFMSSSIHKSICFIGSWRYAKLELKFSCKSNIPHIPNFERIQ